MSNPLPECFMEVLKPCHECGGEVVEFSAPDRLWNAVVRNNGPKHAKEYLCLRCFLIKVSEHYDRIYRENKLTQL